MNHHAKWLRKAAEEIIAAGHNGWANTCTQAADAIDRLESLVDSCSARNERDSDEIGQCRRAFDHVVSGLLEVRDTLQATNGKIFERAIAEIGKHIDEAREMLPELTKHSGD